MRLKISDSNSSSNGVSQFDFGFLDIENIELYDLVPGNINFSLPFGNTMDIEVVLNSSLDLLKLDDRLNKSEQIGKIMDFPCVIISMYDYTYGKTKGEKLFALSKNLPYHLEIKGMLDEIEEYTLEIVE